MLLKSQLVRSSSRKRSKVTRFCSVLYVQASENENESERERERERKRERELYKESLFKSYANEYGGRPGVRL